MKKMYRFLSDEVDIYEAVDKYCPCDDERRIYKPDSSWLLKVGIKFPGAIAFWTEVGLKKYINSGLRDWQYSVVEGQSKFIIAERPDKVLYEDEYQIICESDVIKVINEYPFVYEGARPAELKKNDERVEFLRHHTFFRDWNAYSFYSGSDETFTLMSSVGKELGLKKIGIHHEILKPNKRSSWPHAHKVEEELIYVISGSPDVWVNGKLYSAKAGDVIFFPPDSNLSHTVINNTDSNVEMMVFGEQDAKDDLIYYPNHPKRNEECKEGGYFWENRPEVEMGEHSGEPQRMNKREQENWEYQKKSNQIEERVCGGSENSSKVFYRTRDLGRALGAKRVALHKQVLPSGFRSSLPHAESLEEEFVYVLKGNPIAWINGKRYQMEEGDSAAFPSGTGIAHTFINETQEDVELLISGETTKKENLCFFPLNPEEKESCGIWWSDAPRQEMGNDSAIPKERK
jgi:uncharacterized cupin superfamily protein